MIEVARDGTPVAWSADGDQVLVVGNGTFLVEADGSGDSKASVEIDLDRAGAEGLYCRAADTGLVVARTLDGLVLYDVGKDKATVVSADGAPRAARSVTTAGG